jgi:repressor LexA
MIHYYQKNAKGLKIMSKKGEDKQKKILEFVTNYMNENGYPPSIREICQGVGLSSTSTVHAHLETLKKNGLLEKADSKSRGLRVKNNAPEIVGENDIINVPVVGKVAAGSPILATENLERTFPIPADFLSSSANTFMLKVKGESMIEIGIFDGDYIIVKQQSVATNGEIVVALINDEATVKTFYKEKDYIRLQPENSTMEPIIVKEAAILGKVVGLIRKM